MSSDTRLNAAGLLVAVNRGSAKSEPVASQAVTETETSNGSDINESNDVNDANRPITGQVMAITENTNAGQSAVPHLAVLSNDGNPDKLQMTIEALRANPDMTDEALAAYLALKRPASARFWHLKAIEILTMPGREQTGKTPAVQSGWSTPIAAANGTNGNFNLDVLNLI